MSFVLLLSVLLFSGPGLSQPVTVPNLTPPSFQSTDVDPLANNADAASNQQNWEHLLEVGTQNLAAAWEAGVDGTINGAVSGVAQSDFFNANPAYRDYLLKELEIQKQAAAGNWELAADTAVQARRTAFLASLSENNYNEASAASSSAVQQATGTAGSVENQEDLDLFNSRRYEWERDFQKDLEGGLYDYQAALNSINSDYQQLIGALSQKEQEFQQGKLQIDQYETAVRNGIGQAVTGLTNMLNTSGMFHDEVCDAQNVCTQGALSTAGQNLQTLLGDLNTGLANNAPLSTLTQQMITFLQQQHTYSVTRQQHWQNQVNGSSTYLLQSQPGATHQWATICNPFCHNVIVGANIPQMVTDIMAFDNPQAPGVSDPNPLMNWLMANHESKQVTGITDAHFRGWSNYVTNHPLGANDIQMNGGDSRVAFTIPRNNQFPTIMDTYNSGLVYLRFQLWASFIPPSNYVPEYNQFLDYSISYTTYDANADANANTWQGYVNNLDSVLQHWQNDLLPAIQNWETQTAAYDTSLATWQAQAQAQRAQALNDKTQREQDVVSKRTRWIQRMEQRQKDDARQWNTLRESIALVSDAGSAGDERELDAGTKAALERLAVSRHARNTGLSARDYRLGYRSEQASLLKAQRPVVPDGSKLIEAASSFQKSLKGAFNLSLAETLDERAERQQQEAIEQIVGVARQQDGLIHQQRNLPQRAKDIDAEIKEINKQKRRVFDRLFLGHNVDYIMDKNTNDEGKIAHMLVGVDRDYVKSLEDRIDALRKERGEVLEKDRANHYGKDANFSVNNESGTIVVRRTMSTGQAVLSAGGFVEDAEAYESIDTIQTITLATPGAVKLVETGDIFDDWDYGKIMQTAAGNSNAFSAGLNSHYEKMGKTLQAANQAAMKAEGNWKQSAQGQAAAAKKFRKLLESVAKAMIGGMGLGDAVFDVAKNEIIGQVAQSIGEATGLPVGLLTGLLSGQDPMDALASHMKSSLFSHIESEVGISGLGSWLAELHGKQEAKKRRRAEAKLDTKDLIMAVATGGMSIATSALDAAVGPNTFSDQLKAIKPLGMLPSINQVESLVDGDISYGKFMEQSIMEGPVEMYKNIFTQPGKALVNYLKGTTLGIIQAATYKPPKIVGPGEKAVRQGLVDIAAEMNPALPKSFVSSMFVHGADMKTAMIRQAAAHLAAGAGATGFGAEQLEELLAAQITKGLERHEMKKKRAKAAQLRPEDFTPYGALTYAWRNAQFHKDGALLLNTVETAASIAANAIPGLGHLAYAGYQGMKQTYMGSLNGGLKGALAGIASGVGNAVAQMTSGGQVSLNMAYDNANGFSGGMNFGMGPASVGVNFAEGQGLTGTSVGLQYSGSGGYGGSFSVNMDTAGNMSGNIAASGGIDSLSNANTKVKGSLGLNFNESGFTNVTANASATTTHEMGDASERTGFKDFYQYMEGGQVTQTAGVGLSYGLQGQGTSLSLSNSVGYNNSTAIGINAFGANSSGSHGIGNDNFSAASGGISLGLQQARQAGANITALEYELEQLEQAALIGALDENQIKRLNALREKASILEKRKQQTRDDKELLAEKLKEANLNPDQIARILKNPKLLHTEALRGILHGSDIDTTGSRDAGVLSEITGPIKDGMKWLAGVNSSDIGEVDPATGEFRIRTCFTAGTLIRVKPGAVGSFIQNGSHYKRIEDVAIGDQVLSWNEKTGEQTYSPVIFTFVRQADRIYTVQYENDTELETTWNHPFYIRDAGWIKARDLRPGDLSVTSADEDLRIRSVHVEARYETVYNFTVKEDHNYYVSSAEVLVHNEQYVVLQGEDLAMVAAKLGMSVNELKQRRIAGNAKDGQNWDLTVGERVSRHGGLWAGDKIEIGEKETARTRKPWYTWGESIVTGLSAWWNSGGPEKEPIIVDENITLDPDEFTVPEELAKLKGAERVAATVDYYQKAAEKMRESGMSEKEILARTAIGLAKAMNGHIPYGWDGDNDLYKMSNGQANFQESLTKIDCSRFVSLAHFVAQGSQAQTYSEATTHGRSGTGFDKEAHDADPFTNRERKKPGKGWEELQTGPSNMLYNTRDYEKTNELGPGTIIVSPAEKWNQPGVTRNGQYDPRGTEYRGGGFAGHVVVVLDYEPGKSITVAQSSGKKGPNVTTYKAGSFLYGQMVERSRFLKPKQDNKPPAPVNNTPQPAYSSPAPAVNQSSNIPAANPNITVVPGPAPTITLPTALGNSGREVVIEPASSPPPPAPSPSIWSTIGNGALSALGTVASAVTWAPVAAGRVLYDGVVAPVVNTFGEIAGGIGRHMGHNFNDLSETEQKYVIRNSIDSNLSIDDPRVLSRLEDENSFLSKLGRSARYAISLGAWEDEFDSKAEHFLDHKEGVERKLSNLKDLADKYPDNPERAMAMVTRDEMGYPQAYTREEILSNAELASRFYKDRPRVLIHGKASGQAGSTAFDLDSMADFGNTISIFRDGSQSLEDQAQVVNRQLLEVNRVRERFGWTPENGQEDGLNIAAHSMGNPALLHILAGGDMGDFPNVFRAENGDFRYKNEDLNILSVAPAVGSNVANVMHSSGAGLLRAADGAGADAPATHDLREQNYDYLTGPAPDVSDPRYNTHENYRLAREQFDTILAGTRPGGYMVESWDNDPTSWIFNPMFETSTHDILVEREQIYDVFSGQEDRIHDIHLNHQDQIVKGSLLDAPKTYTNLLNQPKAGERVNFIKKTWSPQSDETKNANLGCRMSQCWTPAALPPKVLPDINWPGSPFRFDDRDDRSYDPTFEKLPLNHPVRAPSESTVGGNVN